MVVLILVTLMITVYTGLKTLASDGRGPLANASTAMAGIAYADEDDEDHGETHDRDGRRSDAWETLHEAMTSVMVGLIIIHVAGVIVSSWLHKENLIMAMLTGKKKVP
jgi:cytochrome b